MKEKGVLVLMANLTKLPQRTIKEVMDGLIDLDNVFFGAEE